MSPTHSPWRRKTDGNIGCAIEALVVEPNDKHGYRDDGYRIVCTYQGRYDNLSGMGEQQHAEAIADTILTAVNSHAALVVALAEIAKLTQRKQLPLTTEINDIAVAALEAAK
jgi:hypothetical protein